ncbi:MAG: hypothetical protein ACKOYM_05945 [Actinomycetes bacterium]
MSVPLSFRRPAALAVVLAVCAFSAAACTGGEPVIRNYGDPAKTTGGPDYYDNFMLGCTGVQVDPPGSTPTKETSEYSDPKYGSFNYCRCVYDGMESKVPFNDAKAFETEQANATKNSSGDYDITIPKNIQTVMDSCQSKA